ncbi:tyrosine-protein phosphatase [Maricaulis sp. D1M11]|uniref:tyrosine-protein phosphatase n=1 Tax=Maricaulis sp. D1M11 TaxID=3076117 RepID=UPI0039B61DB9
MERVTLLDNVYNFRHWHGYTGLDGAVIRPGLFRSGHFAHASDADLDHFHGLNIAVVADLRRPRERNQMPSPWLETPGVTTLSSDQNDHPEPPHLEFLRKGDITPDTVRGYMLSAYQRIPTEEGNQIVFRNAFRALANGDAESGFLVHCAAGKDRTGLFCALVLDTLGVDRDVVMEDYLLTNTAVDYDRLVPAFQGRLRKDMGLEVDEEAMRVFLGVHADFLNESFATIGSSHDYLTGALGITEDEIEALKAHWLDR